jgi:hypothetical protein
MTKDIAISDEKAVERWENEGGKLAFS